VGLIVVALRLSTTHRYTEVEAETLIAVYEKAHPHARG